MIIPNVFQEKSRPTLDETVIDLMESIVQEELALSNLINAEAEKINAFVGNRMDFPTGPTSLEILEFNQSINKMMDTILMKEWLSLRKLETVINIKSKLQVALHKDSHSKDFNPLKCHPHRDNEIVEDTPTDYDCDDIVEESFTNCNCNDIIKDAPTNCDCDEIIEDTSTNCGCDEIIGDTPTNRDCDDIVEESLTDCDCDEEEE